MRRIFHTVLAAVFFTAAASAFAQTIDDNASTTSPGGQKIIGALYEGQVVPAGQTELSKSDIAGMKAGAGWGKLFQQLKLQGRYPEYKNLGQLISSRNRLERASRARSDSLQRTSRGATRPDKPSKPARIDKPLRIERVSRPMRPDRPAKPSRR